MLFFATLLLPKRKNTIEYQLVKSVFQSPERALPLSSHLPLPAESYFCEKSCVRIIRRELLSAEVPIAK